MRREARTRTTKGVLVGRGVEGWETEVHFCTQSLHLLQLLTDLTSLGGSGQFMRLCGLPFAFCLKPPQQPRQPRSPALSWGLDPPPRLPLDCTVSQLSICLGSDLACCVPCACHQVGLKWQSRFNGAESVSEGVPSRPSPFHTFHRAIGPSIPYPSKWTEYIYRVNNQSISVQLAPFSVQNSANEAQLGPLESSCDCNSCSLSISLSAIVKS